MEKRNVFLSHNRTGPSIMVMTDNIMGGQETPQGVIVYVHHQRMTRF